jgi:hypothetical protein
MADNANQDEINECYRCGRRAHVVEYVPETDDPILARIATQRGMQNLSIPQANSDPRIRQRLTTRSCIECISPTGSRRELHNNNEFSRYEHAIFNAIMDGIDNSAFKRRIKTYDFDERTVNPENITKRYDLILTNSGRQGAMSKKMNIEVDERAHYAPNNLDKFIDDRQRDIAFLMENRNQGGEGHRQYRVNTAAKSATILRIRVSEPAAINTRDKGNPNVYALRKEINNNDEQTVHVNNRELFDDNIGRIVKHIGRFFTEDGDFNAIGYINLVNDRGIRGWRVRDTIESDMHRAFTGRDEDNPYITDVYPYNGPSMLYFDIPPPSSPDTLPDTSPVDSSRPASRSSRSTSSNESKGKSPSSQSKQRSSSAKSKGKGPASRSSQSTSSNGSKGKGPVSEQGTPSKTVSPSKSKMDDLRSKFLTKARSPNKTSPSTPKISSAKTTPVSSQSSPTEARGQTTGFDMSSLTRALDNPESMRMIESYVEQRQPKNPRDLLTLIFSATRADDQGRPMIKIDNERKKCEDYSIEELKKLAEDFGIPDKDIKKTKEEMCAEIFKMKARLEGGQ